MDIKFESIDGRSPQYYLMMLIFAVLAVAGLIATYIVCIKGIYITGMTNRVPWGLQIAMAIYYIGLSAGSLVVE